MRETVYQALRDVRTSTGLTQVQLAEKLSTTQGVVAARESGRQEGIPHHQLEAYVEATGIPLVCTPAGWSLYDPPTQTVAFYGDAPCGSPLYIEDAEAQDLDLGDLTDGNYDPDRHYILRARGESMQPYVYEGDWMLVDHQRAPQINDIVVANVNGGVTVKRLGPTRAGGGLVLVPANPQHPLVELTEFDEVECQGVVVGVIRAYVKLANHDAGTRLAGLERRPRR